MTDFDAFISKNSRIYYQLGSDSEGQWAIFQWNNMYLWNGTSGFSFSFSFSFSFFLFSFFFFLFSFSFSSFFFLFSFFFFLFQSYQPAQPKNTSKQTKQPNKDPSSDPGFTFQVQIFESGRFHFSYKSVPFRIDETHNSGYDRNYPLTIGLEDAVVISEGGYCSSFLSSSLLLFFLL